MRSGPLRHKWFASFTATVTSGSIGDEVMRLALPLLVLDLTHDIGAAATLRVIERNPESKAWITVETSTARDAARRGDRA